VRICAVISDFDGPGSYRMLWPLDELKKHGHQVIMPRFNVRRGHNTLNPDTRAGTDDDFLVIETTIKSLSPHLDADVYVLQQPHEAVHVSLVRFWLSKGRTVVVDTDDDLLHMGELHPAYWLTHPANPAARNRHRGHYAEICKLASLITTSTPALAESMREVNDNVKVLPNFLYWPWWKDIVVPPAERVRIGWMGRAFWHTDAVEIMRAVVPSFLDKHPEVDFVAAGDMDLGHMLGLSPKRVISHPTVTFRERSNLLSSKLPALTASMDIGLVPLALNRFNEAKSHLKGMEYGAAAIPAVASPTGPYRAYISHGRDGFLAATPAEWHQALEALLDPATRADMGAKARRKAARQRIDKHWQKWADAYLAEVIPRRKKVA